MILAAVNLIFCTTSVQGDDDTPPKRKKVAVVLSGGGAKGMAHIGALKVIEKAGIPIDIITGTSMGSIIGGLYAIGYNANMLDSLARVQDWKYVITDRENLSQQSLTDRSKRYTYTINRGIAIGKSSNTDGGIILGKNLTELFQQLCAGYTDSLDFNQLPIPFACVATNIVDNTEVDFHSGRLPQAMRASMAIPGVFSPVRVGDKVLVDGCLRNNYPADIARQMGADVIIGVTVQGEPKTAKDLGGTMSIIRQIIDVNCKNKYDENLDITDVAIRVNTTGYNIASFTLAAIDTLIRRGEEEAMRHWDELITLKRSIGLDDSFRPIILRSKQSQAMTERHPVSEYVFENMTKQDEKFLRQKFQLQKKDSIDAEFMQRLTTSMRVDLFYQTAECRIIDGRAVLTAGHRKTAQYYAGLRFDNEEYAALQVCTDFFLRGNVPTDIDVTLRLGQRIMVRGDLTFHQRSFTTPKVNFTLRSNDIDVYINGNQDYNVRDYEMQAEVVPVNFNLRNFNLQAALRWDYLHYRNKLEASYAKKVDLKDEHYFSYYARVEYNSEDNWNFPTRGSRFKAKYAYLTDDFAKLDGSIGMSDISAHWRTSFTIGRNFTLQPMVYGRLLFGSNVPLFFSNAIGTKWFSHYVEQQMPFAGVGNLELVDNQFLAAQLQAQQRIANKHYVQLSVSGAQQADKVKNLFDHRTLVGFQAAYYYDFMLGPIGATLGYSNHTKSAYFYLNLGHEF